jgi:GTP-binding protein
VKVLSAEFVTSAAGPAGVPRDGVPQVALVGRSNVGKSTLVNALARRKVARTSAAPGKTRLLNVYRVQVSAMPPAPGGTDRKDAPRAGWLYLLDLPGYGYARGGDASARAFEALTDAYFDEVPVAGVLHAMDGRHPGLASDLDAHRWLLERAVDTILVATKIDTLSRAERARSLAAFASCLEAPVVPVSAVTGEGLDELWKLIVRLASRQPQQHPRPRPRR